MPKSSRSPQRKRKAEQRARTASQGIENVKPPFPYSLLVNAKFFYALGAGALIVGLFAFIAIRNVSDDPPEEERNPTATPTVGSVTPTPDLTTTGTPSSSETPASTGTPASSGTPSSSETPAATGTPPAQTFVFDAAPAFTIDTEKQYFATITTENGEIRIELFDDDAPNTVNNFVFLAREGFYDGNTFHRVLPGFVAQAGDRGEGTPGYTVDDEITDHQHERGAIAMAKLPGANNFGSQFYIALDAQPSLDGDYTVFGEVVEGLEVLDQISPRDPSQGGDLPPGDEIITIEIEEVDG